MHDWKMTLRRLQLTRRTRVIIIHMMEIGRGGGRYRSLLTKREVRQKERETDRQTDTHTHTHTHRERERESTLVGLV